jgi:HSP20 family protein
MSLAVRTRFLELETLRERVDKLFAEFAAWPREMDRVSMPLDVEETDSELVVTASLPGIKPEDINVEVDRGRLAIRGESREESREEKKGTWHVQERRVSSVERLFTLPVAVKEDTAAAEYKDGVLKVTFKKDGVMQVRKVEVKTS